MDDITAFGYSLQLNNGDLIIENGQLLTVAGKPNLIQALTLRVLTPYGSDQFNTTYGLDVSQAFTQPNGLRMVKELLKLNLVRTLGADPRVDDIREVLFDDDPAYWANHPEIDPQVLIAQHHRRIWQGEVIISTAQGQPVTLPVSVDI